MSEMGAVSGLMFGCYVGFLAGLVYQKSWTTALMVLAAYLLGLLAAGLLRRLCQAASDADERMGRERM